MTTMPTCVIANLAQWPPGRCAALNELASSLRCPTVRNRTICQRRTEKSAYISRAPAYN
jgi:hypothetical protein